MRSRARRIDGFRWRAPSAAEASVITSSSGHQQVRCRSRTCSRGTSLMKRSASDMNNARLRPPVARA